MVKFIAKYVVKGRSSSSIERKGLGELGAVYKPIILTGKTGLIRETLYFRAQLPGRFYELNIHFGVFVGGMGDFNEIFLGNQGPNSYNKETKF